MKQKKKTWWKTLIGLGAVALTTPIIAAACNSNSSKLVIGNYSSYIDEDVANELAQKHSNHNLSYTFYDDNEVLAGLLKSKVIDATVGSAYEIAKLAKRKLIKKIDWKKFGIKKQDGSDQFIENIYDLKPIFTDEVWTISNYYSDYLGDIDGDGKSELLLEYMVPYFYQDFIFAYRGEKISELDETNNPTWNDIFKIIGKQDKDNRFLVENEANLGLGRNNENIIIKANKSKIDMISDARTVYDIAKIMDLEGDKKEKNLAKMQERIKSLQRSIEQVEKILQEPQKYSDDIIEQNKQKLASLKNKIKFAKNELSANVILPDNSSVGYITQKYENILEHFKNARPNSILLKGNSNDVLNDLAMGNVAGAIAYSGDIAFAINGGEYTTDEDSKYFNAKPTAQNIHIVRPKDTLSVLDAFIVNSQIDEENEKAVYEFINSVVFSGINAKDEEDGTKGILKWDLLINREKTQEEIEEYENSLTDDQEIGSIEDDSGYLYNSMRNFDYVNYSPVLRVIDDYVKDAETGYLGDEGVIYDTFREKIIGFLELDPNYTTKKQRQRKHKSIDDLTEALVLIYQNNFKNNQFNFDPSYLEQTNDEGTKIVEVINESLKGFEKTIELNDLIEKLTIFYEEAQKIIVDKKTINEILRKVFSVKLNTKTLETPTNDLSTSNLRLAFISFKNKI